MILRIPDNWLEFKPHLASMQPAYQDDGFGNSYKAPLDTTDQVRAFMEDDQLCSESMLYLVH